MDESEKFKFGDRVRVSALGTERLCTRMGFVQTGKVVGFGRFATGSMDRLVRIIQDGRKTVGSFHPDFWELDEAPMPMPKEQPRKGTH